MYAPAQDRYQRMSFRRCGDSGLKLPAISLGLWHNFGGIDPLENGRAMLRRAFDLGITHFDVANVYGPPPGSAEETLGRVLAADFRPFRHELIIATKAGANFGPGPYRDGGTRKNMVASLDQSLINLGLDYVDVFYSHRPDTETPLEETMAAMDHLVRQGKALYVGISNYTPEQTRRSADILAELGTPCLIEQSVYNMLNRGIEDELLPVLAEKGMGCIVYSPLAQGLLTDKYLHGIPEDSRAGRGLRGLKADEITEDRLAKVRDLRRIAQERGQTLAQMAVAWVLRRPGITAALVGASRVEQVEDNVGALAGAELSEDEMHRIDRVLAG